MDNEGNWEILKLRLSLGVVLENNFEKYYYLMFFNTKVCLVLSSSTIQYNINKIS